MQKWTQQVPLEVYRPIGPESISSTVICLYYIKVPSLQGMNACVNVVRVRSPTAVSSPAAEKQILILMIWVQLVWSISLPYANS